MLSTHLPRIAMLKQPAVASQARGGVPEQVFRVFQGSILMIWQYHPQRQWFFLARSQNLTNQLFQPCHSLFKRHNVNVNIVVLNWQNVISVSGHKTLDLRNQYEPGEEIALVVGSANVLTWTLPHIVQFLKDVQLVQIAALLPGYGSRSLLE